MSRKLERSFSNTRRISPTVGSFANSFYSEKIEDSILMRLIFQCIWSHVWKNVTEDTSNAPQALEELELCNPPKTCVAYYFTNSCAKIRNSRKFSIDSKAMGKDDHSSTATCTKYYPKVAITAAIVMGFISLMEVKAKRNLYTWYTHSYQKLQKSCFMILRAD